jgi:hypothetical protein
MFAYATTFNQKYWCLRFPGVALDAQMFEGTVFNQDIEVNVIM